MSHAAPGISAVFVGLAVHLWAEATGRPAVRAVSKLVASAGFLAVGIAASDGSRYAGVVLAALVLSAAGDALLLSHRQRPFLAGIGAFLLAHVAYAVAFAPVSGVVYAIAITAMLLLALGAPSLLVRTGATLFYLSDLTVARDRFVRRRFANRLVGLPLYYAAQVLLALSCRLSP